MVLAADSTSSFFLDGTLAQSYHHARKLLQLENYPVGLLTYGLGAVAGRNLESLLAEFERTLPGYSTSPNYTIRELADRLHTFIAAKYDAVFPPPAAAVQGDGAEAGDADGTGDGANPPVAPEQPTETTTAPDEPPAPAPDTRPALGIVIGGYSSGEFFPDEFEMRLPHFGVEEVWPDVSGGERYGVRWWGQTGPVERLYLGCDYYGFVDWCIENGLTIDDAIAHYGKLRDKIMWPIIYEGMPLQDAIDLAVYLVNVTIGHSRFAVGPPVCGGHIDVATVTSRGFRWIRRKDWQVKADSVFY